jgi:hypothetical protein
MVTDRCRNHLGGDLISMPMISGRIITAREWGTLVGITATWAWNALCALLLLAAALVPALPLAAAAQVRTTSRQYTGTPLADVNVGVFASIRKNCTAGPPPTIRLATPPAHGKLTVKQGHVRATNLRQCLATDLPAFVAFYRANPDFVGEDTFTLEVVSANGKSELQHIKVVITPAGKRQGI